MEHPFEIGDIVEILPCPYAETFDIVGKTAKVIQLLSFSNTVVKIKVEIGDNIITFAVFPTISNVSAYGQGKISTMSPILKGCSIFKAPQSYLVCHFLLQLDLWSFLAKT